MVKIYRVLAFAGLLLSDGISALHSYPQGTQQKHDKPKNDEPNSLIQRPKAGYEDMKRWKEQQENLKKQEEIIKKGGKIEKNIQLRENQHIPVIVHLVPHSHNDCGWTKTLSQYYWGANQQGWQSSVKNVLDSVFEELPKNKLRRFAYAEMGFFSMWYERQTAEKKQVVKDLVKNGQFEFINGGWSANDEATPNFDDIIDNMMIGHEWIQKEFGVQPRIGWDIDTFGHSDINTRLFAQMGFEAMFFSRLDHADKSERAQEKVKGMNFLWRPSSSHFGDQYQILTNVFRSDYCYPTGFSIAENMLSDDVFVDDRTLDSFNAEDKTQEFINYVQMLTKQRKGQNVMIPWGCDFTFQNSLYEYKMLETIINYVNANNEVNITLRQSTPGEYVDALKKENITWPVRYEDAMPYSDGDNDYWVGYFSSRPGAKKEVKDDSSLINAENRLFSQKVIQEDVKDAEVAEVLKAKEDMLKNLGIYLHHDAITGTAKQFVAHDYTIRTQKVMEQTGEIYRKQLADKLKNITGIQLKDNLKNCWSGAQNDTVLQCPVSLDGYNEKLEFIAVVHNQANKVYNQLTRFKLPHKAYRAQVWDKTKLEFTDVVSDVFEQLHFTTNLTEFTDYEMYVAQELQPNEVSFIKIKQKLTDKDEFNPQGDNNKNSTGETSLSIQGFSPDGEVLFDYENKKQDIAQTFGFSLKYYKPHLQSTFKDENDEDVDEKFLTDIQKVKMKTHSEGAYVLEPEWENGLIQYAYKFSQLDTNVVYQQGILLDQYTIIFNNKTTKEQAIAKVRFSPAYFNELVEFEVMINKIPISANYRGKDVTVNWKFYDGFDPKGKFWTDSNALIMLERNLYHRESYPYSEKTSNISSNYYPIDSAIVMRDQNGSNLQVTIMNDRAQGGSADLSGKANIELLQHRRITEDDNKGVTEPLNETEHISGNGVAVNAKYYLQVFDYKKGRSKQRDQQILIDQPLQYQFAFDYNETLAENAVKPTEKSQYKSLVTLSNKTDNDLTFHTFPMAKNKILLRIENIADKFDFNISKINVVDIKSFAQQFYKEANPSSNNKPKITIKEVSITDNQLQSDLDKKKAAFSWKGADDEERKKGDQFVFSKDKNSLTAASFEPQRIRTYSIEYTITKPDTSKAEESSKKAKPVVKKAPVEVSKPKKAAEAPKPAPKPSAKDLPDPITGVKKSTIELKHETKPVEDKAPVKKEVPQKQSTNDEADDQPQNQPVQKEQVVLPQNDFELVMTNKIQ